MATALVLGLSGSVAFAHDPSERVSLEPVVEGGFTAGTFNYTFQMIDLKRNTLIADTDLLVTHEKKLHFFIYDTALKNLQHLHPDYVNGTWQIQVALPQNDNYWVWVEGQLAADQAEFTGSNRLLITGGTPADTSAPNLNEARTGADGDSVVTLSNDPIQAGKMAMLMVTFSHLDGTAPNITPYLGMMGHAIVVSSDEDGLYHEHCMADGMGMLMLHHNLPEPGNYRVWIQFMDGGSLKMVPLAVSVGGTR
jgi:hypothetical protein